MTRAEDSVYALVERFEANKRAYRQARYNETETRREFIDPLFAALGWDVDNHGGAPEAYKDVIHEDAISIGGAHKAPDYAFRVGGQRKFFVEAKKPSVNLAHDPTPAFQLRRYAWSAKLPVGVLTDFEEFAVYDGTARPDQADTAAVARTRLITYDQYVERWDEIAGLFSREAVLGGSLERAAPKRGTATVDAVFLKEIESWRELLARDIARRNPGLSQRELNFAVQMTIDRVIFLRMAEDRGIEQYGRLLALRNGGEVYDRLRDLFRQADERYNSGLFHFHKEAEQSEQPDDLTPRLTIGDAALKQIVEGLYYPDSPYEFSVLPVDVLGQVYEQFLGKVIQLHGGRVEIEEKPEVRKAGGVYYTPKYIVDYIVKQTVGALLHGKTPRQADRLTVVDPACGSGSFLLGAYTFLLDWRRDWYVADGPEKHRKELYQAAGGEWRLTTAERKKVLLANIHGVDIDPQAVEVTKLSLLLKLLEGESEQTIVRQLQFAYAERVLPDLGANIKCGNSLIGPDFYDNQQMSLLPQEDHYRINVFDWRAGFPQVFKGDNPGFDAVIGNPPYIRIQALKEWAPVEVEHYKRAYRAASKGNYDIYVVFVERGLQLLNRDGLLGYILPHKFFNAQYGEPLRGLISEGRHLREVVSFGHQQVFEDATTYTCLLFLSSRPNQTSDIAMVTDLAEWRVSGEAAEMTVPTEALGPSSWSFADESKMALIERLRSCGGPLGESCRIFQGLVTGADKVFVLRHDAEVDDHFVRVVDHDSTRWTIERAVLRAFINDVTVDSYDRPIARHWILFPYEVQDSAAHLIPRERMESEFPRAWEYLRCNAEALRGRERGKWHHDSWYAFGRSQNLTQMSGPKLIVQVISLRGRYAYDDRGIHFTGGGNGPYYGVRWMESEEPRSLHFLQALVNSKLLDFFLHHVSSPFRGGYWSYGKRFIEQLPIRTIDFANPADVARHDELVGLVERMLALHAQRAAARTSFDATVLERQIAATDARIDRLVYALYELTEDEIRIVEASGATAG